MHGFAVIVGLVAVLGGLYLFALHPEKMPRLYLNQENLHALSKQAKQEIADGTLARKIIAQEGTKRAAAIQAARLERVAERKVEEHILASEPAWPEQYNNAIPLIAPWVYEQKRSVIRDEDLGAAWNELCLTQ